MSRIVEFVPYSGIPDVEIREWHVGDGQYVLRNSRICTLVGKTPGVEHPLRMTTDIRAVADTTQVDIVVEELELLASHDGRLHHLASTGVKLNTGDEVFAIDT